MSIDNATPIAPDDADDVCYCQESRKSLKHGGAHIIYSCARHRIARRRGLRKTWGKVNAIRYITYNLAQAVEAARATDPWGVI